MEGAVTLSLRQQRAERGCSQEGWKESIKCECDKHGGKEPAHWNIGLKECTRTEP